MNEKAACILTHLFPDPPAVLWYQGNVFNLFKAEWLETGAMLSYDFDHGVSSGTGQRIAECDCRAGSEVRRGLPSGFCDDRL